MDSPAQNDNPCVGTFNDFRGMGSLNGTARRLGQRLPPSADRERQCVDAEAPASILGGASLQLQLMFQICQKLWRGFCILFLVPARGYSPTVILSDEPEAEAPRERRFQTKPL